MDKTEGKVRNGLKENRHRMGLESRINATAREECNNQEGRTTQPVGVH